jgi:hypothetical protein
MKYVKALGLMAAVTAALMAFAASAWASTDTSPTGTIYTSTIKAQSASLSLDGAFVTVTCTGSTIEGKIEKHGAGVTPSTKLSTADITGCNFPTKVETNGSMEVHAIKPQTPHEACTSGDSCWATLTSTGTQVSIETSLGLCVFTTSSTSIGTLTLTPATGGKAKLDVAGAIPRTGGSFLCGSSATATGSYTVETPSTLWIDP